MLPTPGPVV